jgi:hypothetical protein
MCKNATGGNGAFFYGECILLARNEGSAEILGAELACIISFVFILSFFGSVLFNFLGMPNVLIPVREILLITLSFSALRRIKIKENQLFYIFIIFILIL